MTTQALLIGLSLIGLRTWRWLWTYGWPEKYVKPRVPKAPRGRLTSDSDTRGLV